jgi:hypothetical protein
MEQLCSHWTDFHEIWYLNKIQKSVEKIQVSLQSDQNNGTLHEADRYTVLIVSRSVLLTMRSVSDKSCTENQNTQFILCNFSRKSCRLEDNVEKYCGAGQATDDNMAHAHCMVDT